MHLLSRLCLTSLACILSTGAQAAIVTYDYTAIISSIVEKDSATNTFIGLDESTFANTSIKLKDTVTGTFSYDTSARPGSYQPEPDADSKTVLYAASAGDFMRYQIGSTGFTVASNPALNWLGSYQVMNSPAGPWRSDYFSMRIANSDDQFFYSLGLFFLDLNGTAFQDNAMPSSLDPAMFYRVSMDGSFLRRSDHGWMHFQADITSLEKRDAAVPEPASLLLLTIGAAGVLSRRRVRQAGNC
jgi:hypothetical protein